LTASNLGSCPLSAYSSDTTSRVTTADDVCHHTGWAYLQRVRLAANARRI